MNKKFVLPIAVILIILAVALFWGLTNNNSETERGNVSSGESVQTSLVNDCEISDVFAFSGKYVEDGTDDVVENVAAIRLENKGDKDIEYMKINVSCGSETYVFSFMTLPAGESITVLEADRKPFAGDGKVTGAESETVAFFTGEMSLYSDVFEVDAADGSVSLRNISDADVNGEIYVYYKNTDKNGYFGGITYRVKFADISRGETEHSPAAHFLPENSKVVFVTYEQEQ